MIKELMAELTEHGLIEDVGPAQVECTVFEDNTACLELAVAPKMRPRTRHIAIKYHHFRSLVKTRSNPTGMVTIVHVMTTEQLADAFTKALPPHTFAYLCFKLMGW